MLTDKNKKFYANAVKYSPEELEYFGALTIRLEDAKNDREGEQVEFNDMSYQEYYDSNLKAANSYIPPKRNKSDTRVVTGTTEEKENTLLSAILNYNLESNVMAFDEFNMEVEGLGKDFADLIKKSREIEGFDYKRPLIYKELLDQGTCFVEEQWVEETKIQKKLTNVNWDNGIKVRQIKWKEEEVDGAKMCETRLLRGDKVFLGNINEFSINKQPYIFTVDKIPYSEATAIYGNWDRFEYVPKNFTDIVGAPESDYRPWILDNGEDDMVEVIKYQDKYANEYMIILNGIMMLPVGFPLSAIQPRGEYTIAKGDVYPISQFFAYSKSIPAKTKVDQEVLDEMMKLIVLKTRKSFMPPYANNTGRILSEKNFMPGSIVNQVDANKIQPIGDVNGPSLAEFNAFQFIKNLVDEKSVSPVFSGDVSKGEQTATEVLEVKKQQMMKLGLVIWGVIMLEKQLAWLRLYNILSHWTKAVKEEYDPITKKVEAQYRREVMDTEVEENQVGKKIIEFSPEASNITPEQIMEEEAMLEERYRMPVRKVYVDTLIEDAPLQWYITVSPTEKSNDALEQVMFKQNIQDAITLFGPQAPNYEYLKKRFATLSRQDPEKFFVKGAPTAPTDQAMKGGDNGGLGAQLNRGLGTATMPQ